MFWVTAPEALKHNTSLQKIYLEDNQIGNDGAMALAEVRGRCPCECSLERVNGSPYAFIAMLLAYMMDRCSVLKRCMQAFMLCQVSLMSAALCIVFEEMCDTQCVVDTWTLCVLQHVWIICVGKMSSTRTDKTPCAAFNSYFQHSCLDMNIPRYLELGLH